MSAEVENVDFVLDLDGNEVRVGDRLAYAGVDGRSSGLRIGTVLEIRAKHDKFDKWDKLKQYPTSVPCKLRVDVEKSTGYGGVEKPTLIHVSFRRFVKIGAKDDQARENSPLV